MAIDITGPLRFLAQVLRCSYQVATRMPRVNCEVRGPYNACWSPDFLPNVDGDTEEEGIRIEAYIDLRLDNAGVVDTSLKDIYIECRSRGKHLGCPQCYGEKYRDICGTVIQPRRVWGWQTLKIVGSLWGLDEPPADLEAILVIDVVAQRPIKKKVKFWF